jgi:serine/threonine protein phosphatase 1
MPARQELQMPHTLTYAVGDIHGSYVKLVNLLRHCRVHAGDNPSRFVFIGDYVDRGRNSREVVEVLIDLQADRPDEVVCLRGNHEEMLIAATHGENGLTWLLNGGDMTLHSYGVHAADEIPAAQLAWFRNLPLAISDGVRFFVHAGIQPGVPLDQQRKEVMLWVREPFLSSKRDHGQFIVHGHTPIEDGKPELLPNRLNIDTGACFGGPLTAAVFDDSRIGPLAFIIDDGTIMPAPFLETLDRA